MRWRIERGEVDSAPDGDDGTASRGEIGGDDARLLAEIARQTLNFAFGVALLEERRVDSFGDLDRGVGLRSEDRHPDRLGPELAGFGVVRLAPSKAGVVVAGVAGVAGRWIRLRVERRAEREAIDDVVWIGRPCDRGPGGLWRDGNGRSRSGKGAFGKNLANPRIVGSNPTVRQLIGRYAVSGQTIVIAEGTRLPVAPRRIDDRRIDQAAEDVEEPSRKLLARLRP